jgi:hypothetical protein
MKNEIILWLSSIVIIFLTGYFRSVTDNDFPITGTFGIEGKKVSYKMDKVSYDIIGYKNIIISDVENLEGKIIWKENGVQKETPYKKNNGALVCEIPKLTPGESIDYKIELMFENNSYSIPKVGYVTLTFWGNIPSAVSILYFILLYGGLLIGVRCFLEIFNQNKNLKKYAFVACVFFLTLNALIIPLRNTYKLGAINKFIPSVVELIDPALLMILLFWIVGTIILFFNKFTETTVSVIIAFTIALFFFSN